MSQSIEHEQMDPDAPPINLRDYDPDDVQLTGFVIVRLSFTDQDLGDDLYTAIQITADTVGADSEGLLAILEQYNVGPGQTQREIFDVTFDEIRALELAAMDSEYPPLHSLTTYYRIDLRHRPEDVEALVARLRGRRFTAIVEEVYASMKPTNPQGGPAAGPSPLALRQLFVEKILADNPVGINAVWAWNTLKSRPPTQGVRLIDLEAGWNFNHKELGIPVFNKNLLVGDSRAADADHGTAVLAILAATNPDIGTHGVVPSPREVRVASRVQNGVDDLIANAITVVTNSVTAGDLSVGDVLLIEVQRGTPPVGGWPVENESADLDAIRLACNKLIVIEAAGNGGHNLAPNNSPALLVGACASPAFTTPAAPLTRWTSSKGESNYGARIHCCAWGNYVTTAWGPTRPKTSEAVTRSKMS